MKKKLSFLLLSVFLLPLFALFGCDEKQSFSVSWSSSATEYGLVAGNGAVGSATYEEGSTVTLTARAKNGSQVIAWVRQNTELLANGDVYKINNTLSEDERVLTSVLTFTIGAAIMSSSTIFCINSLFCSFFTQQMYVQFEGVMVSHQPNVTPVDEITTSMSPAESIPEFSVSVNQTAEQTQVFQSDAVQFEEASSLDANQQTTTVAKLVRPEAITSVMRLKDKQIVMAQIVAGGLSKNFAANLSFRQQDGTWQLGDAFEDGAYKVSYDKESERYFIVFPFEFTLESGSINEGNYSSLTYNLFLTIVYKNL